MACCVYAVLYLSCFFIFCTSTHECYDMIVYVIESPIYRKGFLHPNRAYYAEEVVAKLGNYLVCLESGGDLPKPAGFKAGFTEIRDVNAYIDLPEIAKLGYALMCYDVRPYLNREGTCVFVPNAATPSYRLWPEIPQVFNKHTKPPHIRAVYCGPGSPYGNLYPISDLINRDKSCDLFDQYLIDHPDLANDIREKLPGFNLMCYCKPKRCHCDTILRVANCRSFKSGFFSKLMDKA